MLMYEIGDLFLLNGLSEENKEAAKRQATVRNFTKDEIIYDHSRFERALGLFLEGKGVAMTAGAEKKSFGEGDVFGAAALYGAGDTYISRIVAKTNCTVAFLPEESVRELIREDPVCAENYIKFLSDRIRYLNGKIAHFTCGDAQERVERYIRDNSDDGILRVKNMAEAARLVGLSRSQFYAALEKLEKEKIIRKDGKKIILEEK